tara:strand:- start:84 stop:191 length:108 start_codon:yes stop_codon:yes gene_type:complete
LNWEIVEVFKFVDWVDKMEIVPLEEKCLTTLVSKA